MPPSAVGKGLPTYGWRVNLLGTLSIQLPAELREVASKDTDSEAAGEAAGLSSRAVKRIWKSVQDLYRTGVYPAITFCLRRRGHIVLNRALGHASGNGPGEAESPHAALARVDTPICIFSAAKAVTAVLIHKLAEEGGVRLDERVRHYLPEFAANGKGDTTLEEVLSHRGGFPMFDLPKSEMRAETLLDWDRCIKMICEAPPTHRKGPRLAYHAITGGHILGEVLHRVTGRSLRDYLDDKLRKPMRMTYFTYGLAAEHRHLAAKNYVTGMPVSYPIAPLLERALGVPLDQVVEISNSPVFTEALIPAGNIYCTAEELSRFYQMLLNGGEIGGVQVLRPETVASAVKPAVNLAFDHTLKIPMRYSAGLMLGAAPFGVYGPMTGRAYGHIGMMNVFGWADPQRDISVAALTTGKPVLGTHLWALGQMLTTIAWHCR